MPGPRTTTIASLFEAISMKPTRPRLSAGAALDRLLAVRSSTLHRAQELFDEEMRRLPAREQSIRDRVHPDDQSMLDSMLAAIAPKQEEPNPNPDTTESSEPIRLVGKPRGTS